MRPAEFHERVVERVGVDMCGCEMLQNIFPPERHQEKWIVDDTEEKGFLASSKQIRGLNKRFL